MVNGSRFPPVVVFHHDGESILSDGFHRLRAAKLAKFERIAAEVHTGNRERMTLAAHLRLSNT